jgi:hypothetical protein
MATEKTKRTVAAVTHVATYGLPFLLFKPSLAAYAAIVVSHFVIDRWRLARYVVWAKNWMGPNKPWSECVLTGYPGERPAFMAVWLLIIADNILHVICNGLALAFL